VLTPSQVETFVRLRAAQLEIADVRSGPGLPYEDELVPAAVKRRPAAVRLGRHPKILELRIDRVAGAKHFPHGAPVHAEEVDRAGISRPNAKY
jgi:hypothetical protein